MITEKEKRKLLKEWKRGNFAERIYLARKYNLSVYLAMQDNPKELQPVVN